MSERHPISASHAPSPASQWRAEVGRPIAASYARNPKVAAAIVGGSTAHGWADRYSDIEIGVFWDEPPTEDDRRGAIKATRAELHRLYAYDEEDEVWSDVAFVGRDASGEYGTGVQIEISSSTVEYTERILDDLVVRHDPSLLKQNYISAVIHGIPVHGEALLEKWRARALPYPRELGVAVVKANAQIEFLWRMTVFLERGNNQIVVYDTFTGIAKRLYHVLLGLNRIYYAGIKWMHLTLEAMEIAPPDFHHRLQRVFEMPPRTGIEELATLIEEVYALIEREMPEIDIERLRYFFHYNRRAWDEPPID